MTMTSIARSVSTYMWKRRASLVAVLAVACLPARVAAADANAGALLVQQHGCAGCHGAQFQGATGPQLRGIEHRLSAAQIANAIAHPVAPMPQFGFTSGQTADIVAYLSNLDGGANQNAPIATFSPAKPSNQAMLTVRFAGSPPHSVTAQAAMQMGASSMSTPKVTLVATSDPHVWKGVVRFSMGGPWTVEVLYDGKKLSVPLNVAGSM
jgi:mono/diheme cytochrome c family protein